MWLLVCSDAVESKLVKLETSDKEILPPTVSVLWPSSLWLSSKALSL